MGVEGPFPNNSPLQILDERLHADPSRVVLRPFHLGWQAKNAPGGRAQKLVEDIGALSESEAAEAYSHVHSDFAERQLLALAAIELRHLGRARRREPDR